MNLLKNISFPKSYTELLQWVSYLWAATICFPALQGTFYGVFALLLWGVFKGHIGFSFKNKPQDSQKAKSPLGGFRGPKIPFYFLLAYLLWMTATILWSENINEYFHRFEKLIPLYLLAFIGFMEGIEKHINFNKVLNAFLWGVLIAIGYMVVRMGVDMFVGDTIGRIKTAGIMSLDLLTYINHRTYIGVTLLMAIPLLMMNIKQQGRWQQISTVLFVLFIDMLCIMSSARILMILSVLVTLYAFYYVWGRMLKWWLQVAFFVVFVALGTLGIMNNQRVQSKITQLKQGADVEDVESRTYVWGAALELIKEKPLFGYGMGDVDDALVGKYKEKGYGLAAAKELNAHNQYLQMTLYGGGVALALFFLFVVLLIKQSDASGIKWAVVFVFGMALFVEAALVRNIGIFPFVFWIFILSVINFKSKGKGMALNYNIFLSLLILVFSLVILISYLFTIKSNNPRTFLSGEYDVLNYENLPNYRALPLCGNGVEYDLSNSELKTHTDDIVYVIPNIYVVDLKKEIAVDVHFSIWCYLSNSEKFNHVGIAISDGSVSFSDDYVFKDKGSWQKLEIVQNAKLKNTRFYLILTANRGNINACKVYFANPKLIINEEVIIK